MIIQEKNFSKINYYIFEDRILIVSIQNEMKLYKKQLHPDYIEVQYKGFKSQFTFFRTT